MKVLENLISLISSLNAMFAYERIMVAILLSLLCLPCGTLDSYAVSSQNSYIPPEILHGDFLSHRVRVSRKININQASMQELMALPGVDENIALKIMRVRPIEDVKDLSDIPRMSPKTIQRLIESFQNRVEY